MSKRGHEAAYPMVDMNSYYGVDRLEMRQSGMTIREAFAMAAMQGLLANEQIAGSSSVSRKFIATRAVRFADAVLEELESEKS